MTNILSQLHDLGISANQSFEDEDVIILRKAVSQLLTNTNITHCKTLWFTLNRAYEGGNPVTTEEIAGLLKPITQPQKLS